MYIVHDLLEICSWRTKPVRREEGVDKSHTRSHLLLENSKQKQDLPQELRAVFCQVTTPQYCSLRSSLELRGDPPSPQSPFCPAEHSAGTLPPRSPSLQDVRGYSVPLPLLNLRCIWHCCLPTNPSFSLGSPNSSLRVHPIPPPKLLVDKANSTGPGSSLCQGQSWRCLG